MNRLVIKIFSLIFLIVSCSANKIRQEHDDVLSEVAKEVCKCYDSFSDSDVNLNKLVIRECLENDGNKNYIKLFKKYNVNSFKEFDVKKFAMDMLPIISQECKLSKEFVEESFKTIITTK